jgi:hypothetical protein
MVESTRVLPSLATSLAITNIFDFFPERKALTMQLLSRAMYNRIMPQYLGRIRLGAKALNKLFSYGVDDDYLWTFDCDEQEWSRVKASFIRLPGNESNEPVNMHLDHSMQICVA